ncbi:hypothetical protein NE857_08825 [Nocardiopsis exhalans]|uniref:Uncharacterized protein n=1 Tax=Nocardiopsis exhalans TaxID=163604 RepID=A0ABY5DF10_9ACTN|nr:hypothetical protein [Nocardiopsis exhalans]USY21687.1 hypothetical protein NE857_08825 [Nocardiopsis exhalans]
MLSKPALPEHLTQRGSGSSRRSFPFLSLVSTVACCFLITSCHLFTGGSDHPEHRDDLLSDLSSLRTEDGLYAHPAPDQGAESWSSTFHGSKVMGISDGSSIDFQLGTESDDIHLLPETVAEHGLHGYWWYSQTPGTPLPSQDYINDFQSLFPPSPTGTTEVDIANLAMAMETADTWNISLSHEQSEELVRFTNKTVELTNKPFLLCRSARSLELLGEDPKLITQTWETDFTPTGVADPHELMDVYGSLCLNDYQGNLTESEQNDALAALEPLLENPDQLQDFDAYYLAASWELADGDTSLLEPLSEAVEERISPETGMVREMTTVLGTLQATHMVGWLAFSVNAEDEVYDSDTVAATRQLVLEARQRGENFEELYGGLILRQAGEPDADLEASAIDWALDHLGSLTLGQDNVHAVLELVLLVEQLDSSAQIPDLPVALFEVQDREDRLRAWQLLSLRHHTDDENELLEHFADLVESTPEILEEEQDGLSMVEVEAAVPVASIETGINDILSLLSSWGEQQRGCEEFVELYRAWDNASECDLGSTVRATRAGLR